MSSKSALSNLNKVLRTYLDMLMGRFPGLVQAQSGLRNGECYFCSFAITC